jgi:hypothetical protein
LKKKKQKTFTIAVADQPIGILPVEFATATNKDSEPFHHHETRFLVIPASW